ncbi:MAG TPA: hypothetical protein VMF89_36140 [Polyangiales bacterium]|nr:hypothetical protein [Polyangiales bacterium]
MTQHIELTTPLRASEPRQQEQPEQPARSEDEQEDKEEGDDDKLDEAIDMTFPASDPISI